MSDADRRKWDQRYREGAYRDRGHPTALLAEWAPRLPGGRALDVACGAGRNSLFLASAGRDVDAVDISPVALERARATAGSAALAVRWLEIDLEDAPDDALPAGPYDLIVLVRYVQRAILPPLIARLAPGGALVCEQHLATDEDVAGPRSPAFRLRPNELLRDALDAGGTNVEIRYYREGLVTDPDGRRVALAQIVLVRAPVA